MYWANVPISASSSTTTSPTFANTIINGTLNITGIADYAEGIRIHDFGGISSLWFGAVNNTGYDAGMWGISVNDNGMRFRGTTSTTGTSVSDYMNIIHGGNVGIGTTSPGHKLDVNGTAKAISLMSSNIRIECDNNGVLGSRGSEINNYNSHLYLNHHSGTHIVMAMGGGNVGIGTTSPENKLDINGIQQIYQRGNDNTAFKNLLLLKQQNSTELSQQNWDTSQPSFGIGFRRYWTSGSSPYGETTHAGIYSTVASNWRGGLVFRTKNNETQGGTHDTTALRLRPDGHAIFGSSIETNGPIYTTQPSSNRRSGIIGSYDPNRAAAIWSMGSPYQIATDGTTFGNLYGAAYAYFGSGYTFGAGKSGGHSFVWCQNGTPYVALGDGIWTRNHIETGSYLSFGTYGASFTSDVRSSWRTSIYGNTTTYSRLRTVRTDATITDFSEIYGSGLTWATGDTHGYLSVSYSSGKAWIGGGSGNALSWSTYLVTGKNIGSQSVNYATSAGSSATLSGGSVATWGTLTAANGYTNVCTWDTGNTTGAFSLAGKGGQMSLQLDGFFYQNEGKYLVLDTNNYSSYLNGVYLPTEQVTQEQNTDAYTWIRDYALKKLRGHVYNTSSLGWQYLFGIASSKAYGSILRTTYGNGFPRMQLMGLYNNSWTGWREVEMEKIAYAHPTPTAVGWYRCAQITSSNAEYSQNVIISLQRNYNSPQNEHYIFAISIGYNG